MSTAMQPELKAAQAATIATLTEVTEDPSAPSRSRPGRGGRAPKPMSKYMRLFTSGLKARLGSPAVPAMDLISQASRRSAVAPVTKQEARPQGGRAPAAIRQAFRSAS